MNLETTKISLAKQLFEIDSEAILNQIKAILDKETVVAHSVNGHPLTKSKYIEEIEKAEKDFASGNIVTHNQLLERIKKW